MLKLTQHLPMLVHQLLLQQVLPLDQHLALCLCHEERGESWTSGTCFGTFGIWSRTESEMKSSEEVVGGTESGLEDCSGVNSWKVVRLELNLPLSLKSSTRVGAHIKKNMNRANNCPLLQNVYPVGLL